MTIRVSSLRCKPFPQDLTFVRLEIRSGSWMKMLLTVHNIPYGDVGFGHYQGFWGRNLDPFPSSLQEECCKVVVIIYPNTLIR
jgi:hypothetical protein